MANGYLKPSRESRKRWRQKQIGLLVPAVAYCALLVVELESARRMLLITLILSIFTAIAVILAIFWTGLRSRHSQVDNLWTGTGWLYLSEVQAAKLDGDLLIKGTWRLAFWTQRRYTVGGPLKIDSSHWQLKMGYLARLA